MARRPAFPTASAGEPLVSADRPAFLLGWSIRDGRSLLVEAILG
jgi:hypothetical protein